MTTWDHHEAALAALVADAVAGVEPDDALAALRARTRTPARRRWVLPTAGAALVAAAAVVAVAVIGNDQRPTAEPQPAPSGPTAVEESPTTEPGPEGVAVAVYYVGDSPAGPRLYRELHDVPSADALSAALDLAVSQPPDDPDYEMPWTDGVHAAGSWDGETITVDVTSPQTRDAGMGIVDRSPGMSDAQAALAVQQLVYTAQGVVDEGRVPVQLLVDGEVSDTLLGVPAADPTRGAPPLDTLALASLSTPREGQAYAPGEMLEVSGEASSFEANVTWRLQRFEGTQVVDQGFFTAEGYLGPRLFPFSGEVDLSGVPAGRYTFMVWTDDPSGEGNSFTDSRVITVE